MASETMRALVQADEGAPSVQHIPIPVLEPTDVLIQVQYVAQNPADWKIATYFPVPGVINGCDFAGKVVALGSVVQGLKVGDEVAGAVHGGAYRDKGAFAEYLKAEEGLVWKVPKGMKAEEAAAFGVPWATAMQVLVQSQNKPFPPASENQWIFIYGGSTGVGLFALQIAKLLGYKITTVSSPHSFELVRSYGADAVFDYHDGDTAVSQVKQTTGGGVTLVLDCISIPESFKVSLGVFGEQGGRLNTLLPAPEEVKNAREDIEVVSTVMPDLFGFETVNGKRTSVKKTDTTDRDFYVELCKRTPDYITIHGIRAPPVKIRGGLDDILDGYEDMKNGKVSGERLVFKVAP